MISQGENNYIDFVSHSARVASNDAWWCDSGPKPTTLTSVISHLPFDDERGWQSWLMKYLFRDQERRDK